MNLYSYDELLSFLLSLLDNKNISFNHIKKICAECGFDTTLVSHIKQKTINEEGKKYSKSDLIEEIKLKINETYSEEKKKVFLELLIEKLLDNDIKIENITKFGYQIYDNKLLVLKKLFDLNELENYSDCVQDSFVKGVKSIQNNDYLMAITLFTEAIETLVKKYSSKSSLQVGIEDLFNNLELADDENYFNYLKNIAKYISILVSKYRNKYSYSHPHEKEPKLEDAMIMMKISEFIFLIHKKGIERNEKVNLIS